MDAAIAAIDKHLRHRPTQKGIKLSLLSRMVWHAPLAVLYSVQHADRVVRITRVRVFPFQPGRATRL